MKSNPQIKPAEPFSALEFDLIAQFLGEQSNVAIRACRMEVSQQAQPQPLGEWERLVFPWVENRDLHIQLEACRGGMALQLLLEKQLIEAAAYLHDPNEESRELFVKGAFKALYACEEYSFGDKASQHIQEIINRLGLQSY